MNKKHCEFLNEQIKCDLFDKIGQAYYTFQRQLEKYGKVDKDVILALIFDIEMRKNSKEWLEKVCKKNFPEFVNFYEFLLKPENMPFMKFYEEDAWSAFLETINKEQENAKTDMKKIKFLFNYKGISVSKDGKIKAEFVHNFARQNDSIFVEVM